MGWRHIGVGAGVIVLSACGLVTRDPNAGSSGAGGTAGGAASAGFGGSGANAGNAGSGGLYLGCPSSEPNFGAACDTEGAVCAFGVPCEQWHCVGGAFIKVDSCAGPSKKCGAVGAVCENYAWTCSCGITGEWSCEGGGEDIPEPWDGLPDDYELDGKPCGNTNFQCLPEDSCGPLCNCVQGKWSCAKSVACADPPCPDKTPTGSCPVLGQKCQYTGFCAPTCSCVYRQSEEPGQGLVPQWECISPPC